MDRVSRLVGVPTSPHLVLAEGIASTQYAATGSPPLQALTATVYDPD